MHPRSLCPNLACLAILFGFSLPVLALDQGAEAPDFQAEGIDGESYTLDLVSKDAKATVICFTCNGCPVAQAYEDRLIDFAKTYREKGVKFVAINVNSTEDLAAMKDYAARQKFNFVYAYDHSGDSARAFGARVTPHLFVLNADRRLVYQGAFDNDARDPTEHYLKDAVESALANQEPAVTKTVAFGCTLTPRPKR